MTHSGSTAGDALVAALPRAVDGPAALYEFSVRVSPDGLGRWGRFGAWLTGNAPESFTPITGWLTAHGAPAEVVAAQAATESLPERQGVAIGIDGGEPEFRLYLHGRDPLSGRTEYQSWRWRRGEPARQADYEFHFAPESPDGDRPEQLAPDWARWGVEHLVAEPLFGRCSGFWLRRDSSGTIDQLDLAFPWGPNAGALEGLTRTLDAFALPPEARQWVAAMPVRHLAIPGTAEPVVTLYASAALPEPPGSEAGLQERVIAAARRDGTAMLAALSTLPKRAEGGPALDAFYSGAIPLWRPLLGEEMHYHHALFPPGITRPDDAAMLDASRNAVSDLYPFIPAGARVYDIGCGWGGPLAMLAREHGCRALGLTIAREQFRHIAAMGLPVRWGDAEATLPPGRFDCALLLESFEHIADKPRLLATLSPFVDRLVMRVNCQDDAPPGASFGGTMHMVPSATLRSMLEETGWRIVHWRDRRAEAMPSIAVWGRRLAALGPTGDRHIEVYRAWCLRLLLLGDEWARRNPLIEVVAERR